MKTIIRYSAVVIAIAACSTFNACQKSVDSKSTANTVTTDVQKATQLDAMNGSFDADNVDNDINDIVMSDNIKGDVDGLLAGGAHSPVKTYSPSAATYPHTMIVDYGTGFTTKFGVVKTGKVISYYSAPLAQPGAEVVTTFQNYTSGGSQITGTMIVKNITSKNDNSLVFHHLATRSSLFPNGDSRKLITDKIYFMVSAANVPGAAINNKENYISGSTIGTDVVGGINSYWIATVVPFHLLHKMSSCEFNDGGIYGALVYPMNTKIPMIESLNYGDGTCDDSAVLTDKGKSTVVELPMYVWPIN